MGQGLRRASWSEGGGCGGAAGFSFGERPGSNGGSAGRWLLPFPGNGPGTGGVFLGRRVRAAAGRRASLSGRERVRTDALRGGGCCRSPETARVPAACFFVGGNRLRRGGELLFRGGAGFGRVTHRLRYSPPLFASAVRCHHPPPATTRRLPPLAACHYPPPATSATAACHPCRCLPPRCLSLFPACYHPPPAARYLRRCLRPRFCLPSRRFSPAAPAACLLPPSPACHHPLLPAPPPLPPAACLLPPSPACHHPLLPALPPLLTRRYRPPQQLPATPATLRNLPPPAACHFRRHAPAGRTDGLRRHPAWSVGARCVAGEKFCEIIWKIGKSFLSLFRLSIGVLAFRGRDSCFLLDYHSYGKRDYLSDGGRVQEAQGRA